MENTLEGGGADGENNILPQPAMCPDTATSALAPALTEPTVRRLDRHIS